MCRCGRAVGHLGGNHSITLRTGSASARRLLWLVPGLCSGAPGMLAAVLVSSWTKMIPSSLCRVRHWCPEKRGTVVGRKELLLGSLNLLSFFSFRFSACVLIRRPPQVEFKPGFLQCRGIRRVCAPAVGGAVFQGERERTLEGSRMKVGRREEKTRPS